ncbi:hypothetical protein F5887DRAFT_1072796 [Amanita rubescens]|nr:hypothetical protein F5887DRAFT_1072796 [Amanita rubescens]
MLRARRQAASERYQNALHEAYTVIEQQIATIAEAHGKKVQRVRADLHMAAQTSLNRHSRKSSYNAFLWKKSKEEKENNAEEGGINKGGKKVLQDLVERTKDEYMTLTAEQKDTLVKELEAVKATKAKGFHSSARTRVNDVTTTLGVLENEIANLRSRSGIEALLFITRNSSATPLNNISYATPGVGKFLETVLKMDEHEFTAKMEAFALHGLKGSIQIAPLSITSKRSQRSAQPSAMRSTNNFVSGDESAQMEWKHYWRKVVARHKVMIEGWPDSVPFKNLSEASSALPELKMLLGRWEDGRTYWKQLTDEEAEHIVEERKAQGEVSDGVHRTRSDRGKKRKRPSKSTADDFADDDEGDNQMEQRKSRRIQKRRKVTSAEAISGDEFSGDDD